MKPESSLRGTRQPATCTCPDPDQSSPHPVSSRSILITFSHVRQDLQSSFLPSGSPSKFCVQFPSPWYVRHAPPIYLLDLITQTIFVEG
jgi:hypothetical protein